MGGAFAAGILGAISGGAQGGMIAAKYEMDDEAERRRLYAQELKERRMAEFGLQIKRDYDKQDVYSMIGVTDEEGANAYWEKNPDLKPFRTSPEGLSQALQGDRTSTREQAEQLAKEARDNAARLAQENRARIEQQRQEGVEAAKPRQYSPGSLIANEEQIKALTENGSYTVPQTSTPAQRTTAVKQALELAEVEVMGANNSYSDSDEKLLLKSDLNAAKTKGDVANAFTGFTTKLAISRVSPRLQARANEDPNFASVLDAATAKAEILAEQALINKSIGQASDIYNSAIAAIPSLTTTQLTATANRLIDTAEGVTTPTGKPIDPRASMEQAGLWHPTIRNMIVKTMINHYMMIQRTPTMDRQ